MTNTEELGWQRGLAEGRQEGLQEGRQEGRQEGLQIATLRLLEKRVGPIDEATRNHIAALPLRELEDLHLAVLDFSAADDLQRWFDQQRAH